MSGEGGTTGYGEPEFVGYGGDVDYIPREIKRGPILQSRRSNISFTRPSDFVPGVSRGQVTPSDPYIAHNNEIPAINPLMDKVLPAAAVLAPTALAVSPAGLVAVGE